MVRKKSLILALKLSLGIVGFAFLLGIFLYPRIPRAQKEFEKYQQSNFCSKQDSCRQLIEGVVGQSKTVKISFSVPAGRNSSRAITSTKYLIVLNLNNGEQKTAVILPDIPLPEIAFGANSYLPETWLEKSFVEDYFPVGEKVKVEVWQNEITYVYTKDFKGYVTLSINDGDNVLNPISPNSKDKTIVQQSDAAEIMIPTINHPRIILFLAQDDFDGVIIGFGYLLIVTVFISILWKG